MKSYKGDIKTKAQIQIEQQFLYNLSQIIELCPQYTLSQHIAHIFRSKGSDKQPYFWADENSLKKIEQYYDELKSDLVSTLHEED